MIRAGQHASYHGYRRSHVRHMTEDERQELVGTVAEAHAGLSDVAFKLRLKPQLGVTPPLVKNCTLRSANGCPAVHKLQF